MKVVVLKLKNPNNTVSHVILKMEVAMICVKGPGDVILVCYDD